MVSVAPVKPEKTVTIIPPTLPPSQPKNLNPQPKNQKATSSHPNTRKSNAAGKTKAPPKSQMDVTKVQATPTPPVSTSKQAPHTTTKPVVKTEVPVKAVSVPKTPQVPKVPQVPKTVATPKAVSAPKPAVPTLKVTPMPKTTIPTFTAVKNVTTTAATLPKPVASVVSTPVNKPPAPVMTPVSSTVVPGAVKDKDPIKPTNTKVITPGASKSGTGLHNIKSVK